MNDDDTRAFERLFESDGWRLICKDIEENLDRVERNGLNSPSWDAVMYNRGVRDTMRTLLHYDDILRAADGRETDTV